MTVAMPRALKLFLSLVPDQLNWRDNALVISAFIML
jgi:hypothetical protein